MAFYVGQDVIYVGRARKFWERIADMIFPKPPGEKPEVGKVYKISRIFYRTQCIELVGIYSPGNAFWCEGFMMEGFRPAVKRKTSISIFTAMLNPSPVTVDAMIIADTARESMQ